MIIAGRETSNDYRFAAASPIYQIQFCNCKIGNNGNGRRICRMAESAGWMMLSIRCGGAVSSPGNHYMDIFAQKNENEKSEMKWKEGIENKFQFSYDMAMAVRAHLFLDAAIDSSRPTARHAVAHQQ